MKNQHITLVLTEECNLRCSYCYEKNKTKKSLEYEFIIETLQEILNKDDQYEKCIIEFFGGEPFLKFELIKNVVNYFKNATFKKAIHLFAVTNGTLVHGPIKQFLIENRDILSCGLSFDGNEYSQNLNRDNSFSMVDLDFFAKLYQDQWVKMTISKETIGQLFDSIKFLESKGFIVHCNLAYGLDWADERLQEQLSNQLDLLIQYYLENPSQKRCSFLDGDITFSYQKKSEIDKWCGVGSDSMIVIGADKKRYPCQVLMPTSGEEIKVMEDIPEKVPISFYPKECQNCMLIQRCPTCYSSNFINNGNPYKKDKGFCECQKIIFKKKALLNALLWQKGEIKMDKQEEKLFLSCIKNVLENNFEFRES